MANDARSNSRRFDRVGVLAIDPKALGILISLPDNQARIEDGVGIVPIRGPLVRGNGDFFRGTADVVADVQAFVDSEEVRGILLDIDSPGGEAAGMLDAARQIRSIAANAGKPLIAFSEGSVASAAYALASSAQRLVLSSTAIAGSIGVIATLVDTSEAAAAAGMRVVAVSSGERKADGKPGLPVTSEAEAAIQVIVNDLAAELFAAVAELRGDDTARIAALEAASFVGGRAVSEARIADTVGTRGDAMRAAGAAQPVSASGQIAGPGATMVPMATTNESQDPQPEPQAADAPVEPQASVEPQAATDKDKDKDKGKDKDDGDEDATRAKLVEASKGRSKKARKAKAALKAYDAESTAEAPSPQAADAGDAPYQSLQEMSERVAALEAENAQHRINAYLSTRPDLAPEVVKSLNGLPLERIKQIVDAIPKREAVSNPMAIQPEASATRGSDQAGNGPTNLSGYGDHMDRMMGLADTRPRARKNENVLQFGVQPEGSK